MAPRTGANNIDPKILVDTRYNSRAKTPGRIQGSACDRRVKFNMPSYVNIFEENVQNNDYIDGTKWMLSEPTSPGTENLYMVLQRALPSNHNINKKCCSDCHSGDSFALFCIFIPKKSEG